MLWSEEQRKQEEEESSENQRPRASKILDRRVNEKECKTKLRILHAAVGADMASREEDEEDCRKSIEEERQVPEIRFDCRDHGHREGRITHIDFSGGKRTRDKSCTQHRGPEEIDGRMDMPKADGMAARGRIGVRGPHREIGQRNGFDKLDGVMEHTESDEEWIEDDQRERSSGQFEGQRDRCSRCRECDQNKRSAMEESGRVKIDVTHSVWPWIAEQAGFLCDKARRRSRRQNGVQATEGKSAKVQGMSFANGLLWKRRRAGGPLGKLTCMRDHGVNLSIKATTGEVIMVNRNGVWLATTVR